MTTDTLAPARHVIGSRYVESVKPYIFELTGLYAYGPSEIMTKDYRTDRVSVCVDNAGCISELVIG